MEKYDEIKATIPTELVDLLDTKYDGEKYRYVRCTCNLPISIVLRAKEPPCPGVYAMMCPNCGRVHYIMSAVINKEGGVEL